MLMALILTGGAVQWIGWRLGERGDQDHQKVIPNRSYSDIQLGMTKNPHIKCKLPQVSLINQSLTFMTYLLHKL